ncbi:hypothetical protein PR048_022007 [Dryococelus australis]|uniref:Uncharacterized protein n=1 Tax=Dryococelus australis TaxID=614101 RepID=A0ABQ9GZY1_9NEOP|nr:hypothetical protein PR048_022007 [Dryococelus australis]
MAVTGSVYPDPCSRIGLIYLLSSYMIPTGEIPGTTPTGVEPGSSCGAAGGGGLPSPPPLRRPTSRTTVPVGSLLFEGAAVRNGQITPIALNRIRFPAVSKPDYYKWGNSFDFAVRRTASRFLNVEIVRGDAASREVSSGISNFPHRSIPPLLHTDLASLSTVLKTPMLGAALISPFLRLSLFPPGNGDTRSKSVGALEATGTCASTLSHRLYAQSTELVCSIAVDNAPSMRLPVETLLLHGLQLAPAVVYSYTWPGVTNLNPPLQVDTLAAFPTSGIE